MLKLYKPKNNDFLQIRQYHIFWSHIWCLELILAHMFMFGIGTLSSYGNIIHPYFASLILNSIIEGCSLENMKGTFYHLQASKK